MGMDFLVLNPKPIIAVLSFDVGVILDVGEYVEAAAYACLRKVFCNGVDAASLGPANHPC